MRNIDDAIKYLENNTIEELEEMLDEIKEELKLDEKIESIVDFAFIIGIIIGKKKALECVEELSKSTYKN